MQLFDVILTHSIISASTPKFKGSVCLHEISIQKSRSTGKSKSDFGMHVGLLYDRKPCIIIVANRKIEMTPFSVISRHPFHLKIQHDYGI